MVDIRKYTRIIVEKDGKYLVGRILYSNDLRWSISPWDAWYTRSPSDALKVASKVGGRIFLFNPVARQIRGFNGGKNVL